MYSLHSFGWAIWQMIIQGDNTTDKPPKTTMCLLFVMTHIHLLLNNMCLPYLQLNNKDTLETMV